MSFFKKKPKKEDVLIEEGIKKQSYIIKIYEQLGSTVREVRTFEAKRFVDKENHTVFLKNDHKKIDFLEVFPETLDELQKFDKEKIKFQINCVQKELDDIDDKFTTDLDFKELEFKLRRLKAIQRSLNFKSGSYVSFDSDGQPNFYFKREGSTFHPFKWDLDTSTIYTASDNKKKSSIMNLRNKEEKYNKTTLIETSTMILLFIGVVLTLGNVFGGIYMWKSYDNSNLNDMKTENLKTFKICSNILLDDAKNIGKITDDLYNKYFFNTSIGGEKVKPLILPEYLVTN